MPRRKISIFATFGGHLGFLRKLENCEYLGNGISSSLMLGWRYTPRQWSCLSYVFLLEYWLLHLWVSFDVDSALLKSY